MNNLIREIAQQGLSDSMYGWVNTAATVVALLYSLWHGKKLGVPIWKQFILLAAVYFGMSYILGAIWEVVQHVKEIHFLGIETAINSIVRAFIFPPLIVLPFALILRMKWGQACDAVVMYPLLRSCFAQIACIFPGCCAGYPWAYGIYNIRTCSNHFPTQIIETVLTLLIFIYLLSVLKDKKYTSDGSLYPHMMIFYGVMRFVCELLRDNEKILFGVSAIAIHGILLFAVGIIWMLILYRKKENKNDQSIQTVQASEGENFEACESAEAVQSTES